MSKYFNLKVKPLVKASTQGAAFAAGDVIADWFAFDLPKGGALVKSVTAIVRGASGSANTARDFVLFFANPKADGSAPGSLGTGNATANGTDYFNDLVTGIKLESTTDMGAANKGLDRVSVYTAGGGAGADKYSNMILQGRPTLTKDGFNTIYVAIVAGASLDWNFATTVLLRGAVTDDTTVTIPTDAGSNDDPNAEFVFNAGDVIHAADDAVVGTVKSIGAFATNNQPITFEEGITADLADNDVLFNANPITLLLGFEK